MKLIGQLQIAENEKHTADSPKKTYCGSQAGQRSLPAGYTQFQKNCHMAAEPDGTAENTAGKDQEGNEPHGSAHIFCTLEGDTVSYVHKHLAAAVVNGRRIDSHVFKKVVA